MYLIIGVFNIEMMGTIQMIGGQEIFLVMIVALVLFGADKIPELAKGLGKGMREFKKASDDIMAEINNSTKDIRKDISDVTNSVKKDMDKVTGTIMNEVNDAQSSVQQKIDEVSNDLNNTANSVQQSWNNDIPRNFNDSTEERLYDPYGEAPYDYREVTPDNSYIEPETNIPAADNQQAQNIPGVDPSAYNDPESPYFDPGKA